jgi:hypothetical protein
MTKVVQTFYISTGAKNAMHTLRYRRDAVGLNPSWMPDNYLCNLAVDVETAQAKGLAYFEAFKERVGEREDFVLIFDAEPEYDITKRRGKLSVRDTRCIEDIEDGLLPFGKHAGSKIVDAPDHYVLFFADKTTDADINPVMSVLSAACLGVALEKGLIAKREIARAERVELDAQSGFVGTVGERREFTGEIVTKFYKGDDDGGFWINKIRCGSDLIVYIGNELGERGATVTFKATIKDHSEYKGVKTTKVNRPKVLEAV